MPTHLLYDPNIEPTLVDDAAWRRLSAALTDQVPLLAEREDLLVQIAPGAGHGHPACYLPAKATIEVDGRLLPPDLEPRSLAPVRPADRDRYPVAWGALCHEAAHARHTRWQPPNGTPALIVAAALLLEETRAEAAHLVRRPGDRHWLRAVVGKLLLEAEPAPQQEVVPWDAARAAGLVSGRVDAGVLEPKEAEPVTRLGAAVLGADRLAALRAVWQAAQRVADDDPASMCALGERWCGLLDLDPHQPGAILSLPAPAAGDYPASQPIPPASPVTAAVAAAVAATDAAEQAEQEAARTSSTTRAAAKTTEAAARRHARQTAELVFAPSSSEPRGHRASARWTVRAPTSTERGAASQLTRRLRAAAYRDRAATTISSPMPPGRLRMREVLAAQAQRAAGLRPTATPWRRTVRRRIPTPPLRVGIAVDVSGSMAAFTRPMSAVAWIVAQATARTGGTSATVCYGDQVTAVTRPGELPAQVREFTAIDNTEQFCEALDALDGALGLTRASNGARLLVVVSDGHYTLKQRTQGQARIGRLRDAGCRVLWVTLHGNVRPMDGAQVAMVDDPAAAGAVISTAAERVLRDT